MEGRRGRRPAGRPSHRGRRSAGSCWLTSRHSGKPTTQAVLERLAITDPVKLAQIAYGLLPRDVFISVEQRTPGNLDPDEWAILRRVIDLIQPNANGKELGAGAGDD